MQYPYAVVPSHGCYGSGSKVRPLCRATTLEAAKKKAAKATREYRAAMAKHGGSSGGYRVIKSNDAWWYGHELDRMATE